MNFYLKYQIQYRVIFNILEKLKKKRINFFIDLLNISRGLYNRKTVLHEITYYLDNQRPSDTFINELRQFCNNLYFKFKSYDPFFVIFYDDGICEQNKTIIKSYKFERSKNTYDYLQTDQEREIHNIIVKYYYDTIFNHFNDEKRKDVCRVFYLKQYESDFIPHYCILNDLFDSSQKDILNVILSVDKDFLQTTRFTNTILCANKFLPSTNKIHFGSYDRSTAIQYLYPKAKIGALNAEYVPLFLSITGDSADRLPGIKGYGPAKTYRLLTENQIDWNFTNIDKATLPEFFINHYDLIRNNFLVISFDEQIKRIPDRLLNHVL